MQVPESAISVEIFYLSTGLKNKNYWYWKILAHTRNCSRSVWYYYFHMDPLEQQLKDLSKMPTGENPIENSPTASAVPEPAPVTPSMAAAPQMEYSDDMRKQLPPIRTFNSDLAQAIREKGGSVVRVAIAENERHQRDAAEQSIKSKKNIAFTAFGMIAIICAAGFAAWSYVHKQASSVVTPTNTALPTSLIPSESAQIVNASGMQVPELVAAIRGITADPGIQPGTVKNIVVTEGGTARMSSARFLEVLGTHAPTGFSQALLPDFMIGTYLYEQGSLFIIMHGTAHDFLLAGILGWEPYLFDDMTPLFGIDTSGFTKAELQNMQFRDAVIANRDARAVLDKSGRPLFFYSFLDANTIVLAADSKTLGEIVRRL